MSRYKIWDKTSKIIVPIGKVLTPEQWIEKYECAAEIPTVVAGGVVNGAFFGVYAQMVEMAEAQGCDFTGCVTEQDHLDAIEAFEDAMNAPSDEVTTEERIAAALEAQVLMGMPEEVTE